MYEPREISDEADLMRFVVEELRTIANALQEMQVDHLNMRVHHSAPAKPRVGDVYRADGTDWNPGSGEGIYEYNGTSWTKL